MLQDYQTFVGHKTVNPLELYTCGVEAPPAGVIHFPLVPPNFTAPS